MCVPLPNFKKLNPLKSSTNRVYQRWIGLCLLVENIELHQFLFTDM